MEELKEYSELLNLCFPKPPCNVPDLCMDIMGMYPTDFLCIKHDGVMIAGCLIVIINKGFYGICSIAVHPKYQRQGYGTQIMHMVQDKYSGMFIVRTRNASGFYLNIDYKIVYGDGVHDVMVFVNDKYKVNF